MFSVYCQCHVTQRALQNKHNHHNKLSFIVRPRLIKTHNTLLASTRAIVTWLIGNDYAVAQQQQ